MDNLKTSQTHPLRVDFVEGEELRLPGRLGLTLAPGKKQRGALTGDWGRDLETDLQRLREHYRTDVLVSLIEEHEFEALDIRDLRERARALGIEVLWFPIRDRSVPTSPERFQDLIHSACERLRAGKTVVIHCMGGLGRTGLVGAACLLALTDLTAEAAVAAVRRARAGTVETEEQARYVETFCESLRKLGSEPA